MIIQCPSCRSLTSIVAAMARPDASTIGVVCDVCSVESVLPLMQPTSGSSVDGSDTTVPAKRTSNGPTLVPTLAAPVLAAAPTLATPSLEVSSSSAEPMPQSAPPSPSPSPTIAEPAPEPAPVSVEHSTLQKAIESVEATSEAAAPLIESMLALVPTWDDLDAHRKLVRRAALEDQLAPLGTRYRAVLLKHPDDAASKMAQEEILSQALVRMKSAPGSASDEVERGKLMGKIAMGVVALLMGAAIWFMVISMRSL